MESQSENLDSMNQKWMENLYTQIQTIQEHEMLAEEGCMTLMEYLQVPNQFIATVLPKTQYKNIRFFVKHLSMLIDNLAPYLKSKAEIYKTNMKIIKEHIDNRSLFLKDIKSNGQIIYIEVLPFFNSTLKLLVDIKADLLLDIGPLIYLNSDDKNKKTW